MNMKSIFEILAQKLGPEIPAMLRSGTKEFGALLQALPDSVRQVEEYGLPWTKLPQEIYREKHSMPPYVDHNRQMQMEMEM
jgi:hypothetical protein